ncbi:MAG: thiamine phosphate synthase [Betaproteobacteria bacterium]|nr:thiamine phosphate synthase [Betaproteobacteria bacterium]
MSRSRIRGLYAITPDLGDTGVLVAKVRSALAGGARLVQYRNKSADAASRLTQARALLAACREYGVPLIINDHLELALEVDADGVHLGAGDGPAAEARRLLGAEKLLGVSCYNRLDLAQQALRLGADYVAFGSFFPSDVKPDAVQATPELLRRAKAELAVPVVAIGGISAANGRLLVESGADALAVITAVFAADDVEAAARKIAGLFQS